MKMSWFIGLWVHHSESLIHPQIRNYNWLSRDTGNLKLFFYFFPQAGNNVIDLFKLFVNRLILANFQYSGKTQDENLYSNIIIIILLY